MTGTITVAPGPVHGTVAAVPSKSVTHRAYVLAAQSDGPCTVRHPLRAADPDATLACLHALGAAIHVGQDAVRFDPAPLRPPARALPCRNAGTALRLLAALAARLPGPVILDGDASLRARPQGHLADALAALGARITNAADAPPPAAPRDATARAPLRVHGPLHPGTVSIPSGASSQVASALMLSLPMLAGPSAVCAEAPIASAPYLDVTAAVAAAFALPLRRTDTPEGRTYTTPGHATPRARRYDVEGDWSGAAFFLAAGAIAGDVAVTGLDAKSLQGDRAILQHLAAFGADVHAGGTTVRVRAAPLHSPGAIDVCATPDLFPVLAAVAAHAAGTTTFTGGAALRHKESDRIAAMAAALHALGIAAREHPDGLTVHGGKVHGGTVDCRADHRIHMAASVMALGATRPVRLQAGCETVSQPGFHAELHALRGAP